MSFLPSAGRNTSILNATTSSSFHVILTFVISFLLNVIILMSRSVVINKIHVMCSKREFSYTIKIYYNQSSASISPAQEDSVQYIYELITVILQKKILIILNSYLIFKSKWRVEYVVRDFIYVQTVRIIKS